MKIINIKENSIDLNLFKSDEIEFRVDFDSNLSIESVLNVLTTYLDWEEKEEFEKNVHINLKKFETENLIKIYQFLLNRKSIINNSLIVNINILINGYNTLDDALFESDVIYESDIEQFLDIKLALNKEIKEYQNEISKWYLACLKSMYKVEYTYLDTVVEMPTVYKKIISSSNILSLSQIFAKSDNICTDSLPIVKDAYPTIMSAISVSAIADKLSKFIDFK